MMRGATVSGTISPTLGGRTSSTAEALRHRRRCSAINKVIVDASSTRAEVYLPEKTKEPRRRPLATRAAVAGVSVAGALALVVGILS